MGIGGIESLQRTSAGPTRHAGSFARHVNNNPTCGDGISIIP